MAPSMQSEALEMHVEGSGAGEPSIEQLYNNVCEMESSSEGGSPSRESFGSDGEESRIDSELRHLVAGEMEAMKVIEEEEENGSAANALPSAENGTPAQAQSSNSSKKSKKASKSQLESDASVGPNGKASTEEGESEISKPASRVGRQRKSNANPRNGTEDAGLDNPDLGPFLLKHARDLIASENPRRALKYALRATKSFEKCAGGKPSLNLVMSLHVVAAIYCNLGKYEEAVPVLQRSLEIPVIEEGQEWQGSLPRPPPHLPTRLPSSSSSSSSSRDGPDVSIPPSGLPAPRAGRPPPPAAGRRTCKCRVDRAAER
jgi:hypothetical protein